MFMTAKSTRLSTNQKMELLKKIRTLLDNESGVILTEFAFAMPIFLSLGLGGIEMANRQISFTKISQITLTVADNLSRAKADVGLALPQLREVDINDAFVGAQLQAGNLDLLTNGRIVVSSLQQNASGGQWIAWQRCKGLKVAVSAYGVEGTGKTGTAFKGMGPAPDSSKITADANSAVIFAEVTYTYTPLVAKYLLGPATIKKEAAFYVRDDRDLVLGDDANGTHNPSPAVTKSTCNLYSKT
jgi:Flp pilus assembly protein TadG